MTQTPANTLEAARLAKDASAQAAREAVVAIQAEKTRLAEALADHAATSVPTALEHANVASAVAEAAKASIDPDYGHKPTWVEHT